DGELEHALLAGLVMDAEPGFAMAAAAETPHQAPQRPMHRAIADAEIEARRLRRVLDLDVDGGNQAVAVSMHGLDDRLVLVAERLAQPPDAFGEHGVGEDAAWPDGGEQLVLGDDFSRVLQEEAQDLERLVL